MEVNVKIEGIDQLKATADRISQKVREIREEITAMELAAINLQATITAPEICGAPDEGQKGMAIPESKAVNPAKSDSTPYTYQFPYVQARYLVATTSEEEAERFINKGFSIFAVPQMFNAETGPIVLYCDKPMNTIHSARETLERAQRQARRRFSEDGKS